MFGGVQNTGNPYSDVANEELEAAQQNQNFWNGISAAFNPQSNVLQTPSSAPAYGNISGNAQNILQQASSIAPGGTSSNDLTAGNRNIQNTGGLASRTEDLNNFLSNLNENNKSAEQREMSMFGNTENVNAKNNELNYQIPQQMALSGAKTQNDINQEWNKYYSEQPSVGDEIASAAGGLFGGIAGRKAGQSLFGGTPQIPNDEYPTNELESYANPIG